MKFTYSANVLCAFVGLRLPECGGAVGGDEVANLKEAEASALNRSRERGWLQIGEDVFCPECAGRRAQVEAIQRARFGKWMPRDGVKVRFTNASAGREGDRAALLRAIRAQRLVMGKVYVIRRVHMLPDGSVMMSCDGAPGIFYNVEAFEFVDNGGDEL